MKDKIFGVLQRVGRSFMLPIAILPVAGLLLGIGSSFTNETMLEAYKLQGIIHPGNLAYALLDVMSKAGSVVFDNLALLFAMGVAIGMAKKEKEVAALSGAVAFLVMHATISALIHANGGVETMAENSVTETLGITTLQMGVFGGIIVGLGVSALHNRFYKISLPQVVAFFGGTRFVPIISALVYVLVGVVLFYVWPIIQSAIAALGNLVLASGYAGTWIYGTIERALIPFGLHHVFYMPFWQTALGGEAIVDGNLVQGAQNIFFAQLASKSTRAFSVEATRFMAGKFPFMIFGLPGGALAMYKCARKEKQKVAAGLLLSAAVTAILTGITEPLEFTFIFVAPLMYGVHCILAGSAFMLMHIFKVGVGMTFSGGLIDLVLFGVLQGNAKTNWIYIPLVGIVYFFLYYFIFRFMIRKFNYITPGREKDDEETKLYTRADVEAKNKNESAAKTIVQGLGGKENISDVDCCATRLRITVKAPEKVQKSILNKTNPSGILQKGTGVQIIYGPKVTVIRSELEDYIARSSEKSAFALGAHLTGRVVKLENVEDEVFSQGILGKGCAVVPSEGRLYAPCDGKAVNTVESRHAIGIKSNFGAEILMHIGLETVSMKGVGFKYAVNEGDSVKKGDLLIEFDLEEIKKAGLNPVTPMVVVNSDEFSAVETKKTGQIKAGEEFIELKK